MVTITFHDGSTLVVDATLSQAHGRENEVTDHPVEDGANVTDNIRAHPRTLTIEGVISATPITPPGIAPPTNPHIAAYVRLEAAASARKTIAVATGLKKYPILAIQSLSASRTPETGIDLYFTLTLKEIVYATTATTTVPASALGTGTSAVITQRQATARKHRGVVQASTATAAQQAAAAKAKGFAVHKPQARYQAFIAGK